jgi:sulfur carrier protein
MEKRKIKVTVKTGDYRKSGKRVKHVELNDSFTVTNLLLTLNIQPETVIVEKDGFIVPDDCILKDGDSITVLSIISGG